MAQIYRVRTTILGFQGGPGLSTTYHAAGVGQGTLADATAAAARVRSAWDVVKSLLATTVTAQVQSTVDVIADSTGSLQNTFTVPLQAVVTGLSGAASGPAQVAGGLTLETGNTLRGRRVRGRLYISPLSGAFTNAIAPSAGVLTALNAMGVSLLTVAPPAAVAPLVVWSRPLKSPQGVIITNGISFVALGASGAGKWFSIRSRRD